MDTNSKPKDVLDRLQDEADRRRASSRLAIELEEAKRSTDKLTYNDLEKSVDTMKKANPGPDPNPGPDDIVDVRSELLKRVGEWFDANAAILVTDEGLRSNRYPALEIMIMNEVCYGDNDEPYFQIRFEEKTHTDLEGYQSSMGKKR